MELDLSLAFEEIREMAANLLRQLPNVLIALVVFAVFFFVARYVRRLIRAVARRKKGSHALAMVLGRLAQWGVVVLGVLVAVTILFPTFKPGDLITLLGVSGVAIGFAFKDIFQNFLAGILILLTRPFEVGDQIIVGVTRGLWRRSRRAPPS